jgi:hypothetical protein
MVPSIHNPDEKQNMYLAGAGKHDQKARHLRKDRATSSVKVKWCSTAKQDGDG